MKDQPKPTPDDLLAECDADALRAAMRGGDGMSEQIDKCRKIAPACLKLKFERKP